VRLDPLVVQIAAEPDPARRIERLLDAACDLVQADGVALSLADGASGDVRVVGSRGAALARDGAGAALTAAVVRAASPVRRAQPGAEAPGTKRAWLGVPIFNVAQVVGVLLAHRTRAAAFSDDDECLLALLAALVGGALR
jgi:GAF domain-containing protein